MTPLKDNPYEARTYERPSTGVAVFRPSAPMRGNLSMRGNPVRIVALLTAAFAAVVSFSCPAFAGTTGGISGHVVDSVTQAPIAGAKVTAASPSETETATTDANGAYAFVSLAPDTYTVTASKDGY